jgi:hypothetical protein
MAAAAGTSEASVRIFESAPDALNPELRKRLADTYEWLRIELVARLTKPAERRLELVGNG